jgi:thioredoxin 1
MISEPDELKSLEKIIESEKCVLVDFYADWCEPCKWLEDILDQLLPRVKNFVSIVKINIEEVEAVAEKFNVRSVPVLILFKNGDPVWRINGFLTEDELEKLILEKCSQE